MSRSLLLIGWKRTPATHGIVLSMQVAQTSDQVQAHDLERVDVVLNDRQLRSLARDLIRAADERGMDVFHRPRGWRRVLALFRR